MSPPTDSAARSRALVVRSSGLDPDGRLVPMRPMPESAAITRGAALLLRSKERARRDAALLRAIELV
jgi:hypothetical protein